MKATKVYDLLVVATEVAIRENDGAVFCRIKYDRGTWTAWTRTNDVPLHLREDRGANGYRLPSDDSTPKTILDLIETTKHRMDFN